MPKHCLAKKASYDATTEYSTAKQGIALIQELQNRLLSAGLSLQRPALFYGDSVITYAGLFNDVAAVADLLRSRRVGIGDRVAFILPDCPLMVLIILAAAEISAVYCGMNIKATPGENAALLWQCNARLVIYDHAFDGIRPVLEGINSISREETEQYIAGKRYGATQAVSTITPEAVFGISFTSGTAGISKGVFHTVDHYVLCAQACINRWGLGADDVLFSAAPLLTTLSLGSAVFPALLSGAGLVISGKRTAAEIIATIEHYRCTFLVANPTICRRMLTENATSDTTDSILKAVTVAGAPVHAELGAAFRQKFRCRVFPHYGMTELLAITSTGIASENNTVGKPFEHVQVRITDGNCQECALGETGKIMVKSKTMTSNYLQNEYALPLTEDGWFDTGDMGRIDSEGNLLITGRSREMIIRNGNNIFPQEIECRLLQHSEVNDCAVIGVPEPERGEKIVAFIASSKPFMENEIKKYLSSQLPVYKIPDEFVYSGEIPRNVNQKINRDRLKSQYKQRRTTGSTGSGSDTLVGQNVMTGNIDATDCVESRFQSGI